MASAAGSAVAAPAPAPEHRPLSRDWQGWASCAAAAAGFVACLVGWLAGGGGLSLPWAPALGLRLSFSLDGLGALYALLATGVGVVVFAYGTSYLSLHLEHQHRPAAERWRFWPWMALFAAGMVGLATAQDLVLVFVFFDLTAVCSYFLIGFDRHQHGARTAAMTALLVTVVSAVAMLVAAVLLHAEHGTFAIPVILAEAGTGTTTTVAAALLAVSALAKSAQVPLHFWLPRAMAAPTPVSAYLHSAAMVAAGVLVLGRVHPLLARSDAVLTALAVVGTASIVVGGLMSLVQDQLKQVLAYSTISQYGYVVLLYGLGGAAASGAAAFYVLAHGVAKSALFMTAGAVTTATDEDRLSRLGGLGRRAPLLAVGAGAAAATLAALPLTVGFFKDELFFAAALQAGPLATGVAVLAATLTFAYTGRFWTRLFLGPVRTEPAVLPRLLVVPVVLLGAVGVLGGLVTAPFTRLAEDAGTVTAAAPVALAPAYHLDARPENLMALAAWVLGGLLIAAPGLTRWASRGLVVAGDRLGPRRTSSAALRGLSAASAALHSREVRSVRTSVAAVLVPGGLLTALAFFATPTAGAYAVGDFAGSDWLIVPLLALVAAATVAAVRAAQRLVLVLALSVVGFALAVVYALVAAPDVALVAVVVETMLTLVFLGAMARLPAARAVRPGRPAPTGARPWRRRVDALAPAERRWPAALAGTIAGLAVFGTVWGFLSQPAEGPGVSAEHVRLAPAAHAADVVTVIVSDFRGLDTMVEITVLLVAGVGVATLLRRGKLW
ncbi:hydrogen gas-evolving membrane-bound hydrogenase subunit E [Quadrisphaera sp. DSM 44207]|uniref:hydrogen gas-evolving membrane-bound hydrogenase subunit E n=1 Tax=Quadrisphaera sp. DSM 44207 TaxID=1881057 RepID=UPI00088825E0|nr:hydrogen gas-evolving membrane-bound hydrogenase subunit E [Quadrisphaera sp. DSM 44207]SDQ41563.1 multicomponent Na+:H+ antiporter subunit A [Quadrisphaera sp. DSM 44207]